MATYVTLCRFAVQDPLLDGYVSAKKKVGRGRIRSKKAHLSKMSSVGGNAFQTKVQTAFTSETAALYS